jgi:hypothetical protein
VSIPSFHTFRLAGDVYVDAQDLSSDSHADTVELRLASEGTDLFLLGSLDDLQRRVVEADRALNRLRASRADADARAQEQNDLRVLSGEHPVIETGDGT